MQYTEEFKRLRSHYIQLREKSLHFKTADDRIYREVWRNSEQEVRRQRQGERLQNRMRRRKRKKGRDKEGRKKLSRVKTARTTLELEARSLGFSSRVYLSGLALLLLHDLSYSSSSYIARYPCLSSF